MSALHHQLPPGDRVARVASGVSALAVLVATFTACTEVEEPRAAALHDAPVLVAEGPDLTGRLNPDRSGLGWVTEPFQVHSDADRLGLRFDAESTPTVEARVSFDGGASWEAWRDAEITFQESIAHNAHVDFAPGATHAQIRFRMASPDAVSFLAVESFRFAPEPSLIVDPDEPGVLQQALVVDHGVVRRSEWGARSGSCTSTHVPGRMTIHHTDTPTNDAASVPARLRQIQSYHIDSRGWCDIGYHFLIGQDGKAYQGRVESLVGAHVTGNNTGNMGISFMGSYMSVAPVTAMMNEGARIMKLASDQYGIALNSTQVRGHRDYGGGTDCPGNQLYPRLGELIDLAKGGGAPVAGTLRGAIFWGTNFSTDINDTSKRIAGATVRLQSGVTTTTDHAGNYVFNNLTPGSYQVTASASGYTQNSTSVTVTSGTTVWGSIMLSPVASEGTKLVVSAPQNGAVIHSHQVVVTGSWHGPAPSTVTVNGWVAGITDNTFRRTIDLSSGTNVVNVVASSATGAELDRVTLHVTYEGEDPGSGGGSGGCGGLPPMEPKHPWLPPGAGQAAVLLVGALAAMWQRGRWF